MDSFDFDLDGVDVDDFLSGADIEFGTTPAPQMSQTAPASAMGAIAALSGLGGTSMNSSFSFSKPAPVPKRKKSPKRGISGAASALLEELDSMQAAPSKAPPPTAERTRPPSGRRRKRRPASVTKAVSAPVSARKTVSEPRLSTLVEATTPEKSPLVIQPPSPVVSESTPPRDESAPAPVPSAPAAPPGPSGTEIGGLLAEAMIAFADRMSQRASEPARAPAMPPSPPKPAPHVMDETLRASVLIQTDSGAPAQTPAPSTDVAPVLANAVQDLAAFLRSGQSVSLTATQRTEPPSIDASFSYTTLEPEVSGRPHELSLEEALAQVRARHDREPVVPAPPPPSTVPDIGALTRLSDLILRGDIDGACDAANIKI